jgi:hypothetical protein
MRALLALIGLAALVVVVMMSLGLLTLQTKPGSLPSLSVNGGTAPEVKANVATVTLGTANKTIDVPTVTTTEKTITVPTMKMEKPGDGTTNTTATQ